MEATAICAYVNASFVCTHTTARVHVLLYNIAKYMSITTKAQQNKRVVVEGVGT